VRVAWELLAGAWWGFALLIGGSILTFASAASTSGHGGYFLIFYGAILGGGLRVLLCLFALLVRLVRWDWTWDEPVGAQPVHGASSLEPRHRCYSPVAVLNMVLAGVTLFASGVLVAELVITQSWQFLP
jgi:hypothetical protein